MLCCQSLNWPDVLPAPDVVLPAPDVVLLVPDVVLPAPDVLLPAPDVVLLVPFLDFPDPIFFVLFMRLSLLLLLAS